MFDKETGEIGELKLRRNKFNPEAYEGGISCHLMHHMIRGYSLRVRAPILLAEWVRHELKH